MILAVILLLIGFVVLIKGADYLVDGASSLSARLGIAPLVIGLTVVAFGTSAPELLVNIFAAASGNTDMAIGNVVGSNIANILLILGVTALVYPPRLQRGTTWKEIPFSFLAVLVLGILVLDVALGSGADNIISRADGLILLAFMIIFVYYTFGIAKSGDAPVDTAMLHMSVPRASLGVVGGIIGLVAGGKLIVDNATVIATSVGLSDAVIGLTVVAIGTSLPELATSVAAALKRNADIAVGNIVGSNIFNIFLILGTSAVIRPLPFGPSLMPDIIVLLITTALLFLFLFVGRRHSVDRWQGGVFVGAYVVYVVWLLTLHP